MIRSAIKSTSRQAGLPRRSAAKAGEIASTLAVLSLLLMVIGVMFGASRGPNITSTTAATDIHCNRACVPTQDIVQQCGSKTTCVTKSEAYGKEGREGEKYVCWDMTDRQICGTTDPLAKGRENTSCTKNSECDGAAGYTCQRSGDGGTCVNAEMQRQDRISKNSCEGNYQGSWKPINQFSAAKPNLNLCFSDRETKLSGTYSCECGADNMCWNTTTKTCIVAQQQQPTTVTITGKVKITGHALPANQHLVLEACNPTTDNKLNCTIRPLSLSQTKVNGPGPSSDDGYSYTIANVPVSNGKIGVALYPSYYDNTTGAGHGYVTGSGWDYKTTNCNGTDKTQTLGVTGSFPQTPGCIIAVPQSAQVSQDFEVVVPGFGQQPPVIPSKLACGATCDPANNQCAAGYTCAPSCTSEGCPGISNYVCRISDCIDDDEVCTCKIGQRPAKPAQPGSACNFTAIAQVTDSSGNIITVLDHPELDWKYKNNKSRTDSFQGHFRSYADDTRGGAVWNGTDPVIGTYKQGDELFYDLINYDKNQFKLVANNIQVCDWDGTHEPDPKSLTDGANPHHCTNSIKTIPVIEDTNKVNVQCNKKVTAGWLFQYLPPSPTPSPTPIPYGDLNLTVASYNAGHDSGDLKKLEACDYGSVTTNLNRRAEKPYRDWSLFSSQWGLTITITGEDGTTYSKTSAGANFSFKRLPVGKYTITWAGTNTDAYDLAGVCTDDVIVEENSAYSTASFKAMSTSGPTNFAMVLVQNKKYDCDTRTSCSACKNPDPNEFKGSCMAGGLCCKGSGGGQGGGAGCFCTNKAQCERSDTGRGQWQNNQGYCDQSNGKAGDGLCCVQGATPSCEQRGLPKDCDSGGESTGGKCFSKNTCMYRDPGNDKCWRGTCTAATCGTNVNCSYVQACGVPVVQLNCSSGLPIGGGTGNPLPTKTIDNPLCAAANGVCSTQQTCTNGEGDALGRYDCPDVGKRVCCQYPDQKPVCERVLEGTCKSSCVTSRETASGTKGKYGCSASSFCCVPTYPDTTTSGSDCEKLHSGTCAVSASACPSGKVSNGHRYTCPDTAKVCCEPSSLPPATTPTCVDLVRAGTITHANQCRTDTWMHGDNMVPCKSGSNNFLCCTPGHEIQGSGTNFSCGTGGSPRVGTPIPTTPPSGGLSCVPPDIMAKAIEMAKEIASRCKAPDGFSYEEKHAKKFEVKFNPFHIEYGGSDYTNIDLGSFDLQACVNAYEALAGIGLIGTYDAQCRLNLFISLGISGCGKDLASVEDARAQALKKLADAKAAVQHDYYKGVDYTLGDACKNGPFDNSQCGIDILSCWKDWVSVGNAACSQLDAINNDLGRQLVDKTFQAMRSCVARFKSFSADIDVQNSSTKTIDQVTFKVCTPQGVCEEKTQTVNVKPGGSIKVSQAIDTIKGTAINGSDKHTVSCVIRYSDGTSQSCPEKSVRPGNEMKMSVNAKDTGMVANVTSVLELADCADHDGKITTLDYIAASNRLDQTGAAISCDNDQNGVVDITDLSKVIDLFDRDVE